MFKDEIQPIQNLQIELSKLRVSALEKIIANINNILKDYLHEGNLNLINQTQNKIHTFYVYLKYELNKTSSLMNKKE
jgi:hypothetical protein